MSAWLERDQHPVASARSFLFVPADRPERYAKAAQSGADAVIVDLEDAVPLARKAQARDAVLAHWSSLHAAGTAVMLRLDASDGLHDVHWLAGSGLRPDAIMWPKAESGTQMQAVAQALPGVALVPLIESVAGLDAVNEIAKIQGVIRLAFGHLDFALDLGLVISADQAELAPVRLALAMATRRHGLAPAIDGVTVDLNQAEALRADVQRGLHLGMQGKLSIHPTQVEVSHQALAPTADECAWAQRVLSAAAAAQGAAVQLDGTMVDAPVIKRAQQLLLRAR